MQNDFEKQVQQKMEELNFVPSEPVWTNIEREIRKKDKRRFLIWLPVLFLLAGGGLYWNYSVKKSAHYSSEQKQVSKINLSSKRAISAKDEKTRNLNKNEEGSKRIVSLPINSNKTEINNSVQKTSLNVLKNKQLNHSLIGKKLGLIKEHNDVYVTEKNDIEPAVKQKSSELESVNKDRFSIEHILNEARFNLIFDAFERRIVNSENEKKVVVAQKHHWVIGLEASIGISNQSSGKESMDKSYANAGGPSSYPSSSDPKIQSPYTQGLSYSVGLTLNRKLNKFIEFQTGITYQYLSFNVMVGQYVRQDTIVNMYSLNQYYRNTSFSVSQSWALSNYKNQLYLITIPIKLDYQPFEKVPVKLSAGILLQQLIHSNMLIYDESSGVYYSSNKSLNKFLVSSTLGIEYSFPFLKHRFSVGPYINYGLSNTIKDRPGQLNNLNLRASVDIKKVSKKQRF